MNISKIAKFGIAAVVVGIATSFATADTNAELQARLEAAEARIAELSVSDDNWLNDERAKMTRQLVHDVLADADSRAMMQGSGSPVTVNVHGLLQTRYDYSGGGDDEANHGFSVPRARLILSGDLYNWGYKVSGQWTEGGDFDLLDAYGEGGLFGGTLRVGQFKAPFMREVLVDRADTLMVDRSIVSNQFGQGRSQGVQFSRDFGVVDFAAAYTDGFDTANGAGVQNGQAFTARAGVDIVSWWNVGAAISWNDLVDTTYTTYTLDSKITSGNFDLTAAYVATSGDAVGDDWGATVQVGYMCMDDLQGYVAYEYGELEGVTENLSTFTVGANYWINDNVKWTTDLGYALNGIDGAWDLGNTGWRAGDSGEYLVRTQLQITF